MGSTLTLTTATTATGDDVSIFTASPLTPGGVLWTGYPGALNVGPGAARPAVNVPAFDTVTNFNQAINTTKRFDVPNPADQLNSPDGANAQHAYAVRSTNKQLRNAVHWYSNTSAGATTARYPTLTVNLADNVFLPNTHGLRGQPALDYVTSKVYVGGCNALFELDYSSAATWQRRGSTFYCLTATGRAFGTTTSTAPKNYIWPSGSALITALGRVVVPDFNPTAPNATFLNNFDLAIPPTADRHVRQLDLAPGRGTLASQLLFDYDAGHAYAVTSNNLLIRANVMF
jgi:hypothetical protein